MHGYEQEHDYESQLTELATIFAAAILRLRRRVALNPPDSSAERLDVPPEIRLTVHNG